MNNSLVKRECELKCKVRSNDEELLFIKLATDLGFVLASERRELDYVPDVEGFKCRANGLLLRFRRIIKIDGSKDILLTLKVKRVTEGIKDANEIQFYFSEFDQARLDIINGYLKEAGTPTLKSDIASHKNFDELRRHLSSLGYTKLRAFNEKQRKEFVKNNAAITIDAFPENIGKYLEVEAESPEELRKIIDALGISRDRQITTDYGDLIKEKKKEFSDEEQRTCLFNDSLIL